MVGKTKGVDDDDKGADSLDTRAFAAEREAILELINSNVFRIYFSMLKSFQSVVPLSGTEMHITITFFSV